MRDRLGYLTGPAAVDVAAVLDIPTETSRGRYGEPVRYLDLDRLDAWTRFRIVWIVLGVGAVLESPDARSHSRGGCDHLHRDSAVQPDLARRVACTAREPYECLCLGAICRSCFWPVVHCRC